MLEYRVFMPVSYTHLDVYKRQGFDDVKESAIFCFSGSDSHIRTSGQSVNLFILYQKTLKDAIQKPKI